MGENTLTPLWIERAIDIVTGEKASRIGLQTKGKRTSFSHTDGSYDTPSQAAVEAIRTGGFPEYVRSQPSGKVFPLAVGIRSSDSRGIFDQLAEQLDPRHGLQTLRARDCDGIEREIKVVAQQLIHEQRTSKILTIPFYAPDPYWKAAEETSETDAHGTVPGDNAHFAPHNIGSAEAHPTLTIEPQATKYATQGYQQMSEVAWANRSEFPLTGPGSGTYLIDLTGSPNATFATNAIIDVAAITQTATTTVSNVQGMPFDISVASTAAFDQEGLCLLDPGGGSEEQFEYEIKDATTLTLLVRALGGSGLQTHTANYTVHQSRMLLDGADISVWVDNVQIESAKVNIEDIDTAATAIWIEIAEAPKVSATLLLPVGAGATAFVFTSPHEFKVGEFIVGEDAAGNWETMYVTAITNDREISVRRAVRSSVGGSIFLAADIIYKAGHHIQVAWNYTRAVSPRPTNPDPPLIDLTNVNTHNESWVWDMASVPWGEGTKRAGGWRRIIYPGRPDVPQLIRNRLSAKTTLVQEGATITWRDEEPAPDAPNFDAIEFTAPCGIRGTASALAVDYSVGWPFFLQFIGRDLLGLETLIESASGHTSATATFHTPPYAPGTDSIDLTNVLQALIIRARNVRVTSSLGIDSNTQLATLGGDGQDAQSFELDAPTPVEGILIFAAESTGGTGEIKWSLSKQMPSGAPGPIMFPVITNATPTGPSFAILCGYAGTDLINTQLPPGRYMIEPWVSVINGSHHVLLAATKQYTRGSRWEIVSGVWTEVLQEDLWFAILSDKVDNQPEELFRRPDPTTGPSDTDLSAIIVAFDFDTPRTPIVEMMPAEEAYHVAVRVDRHVALPHGISFVQFRLQLLMTWTLAQLSDAIIVDTEVGEVTAKFRSSTTDYEVVNGAIRPDVEPWMPILPRNQYHYEVISDVNNSRSGTVEETVTRDEDYTLAFRSRWQA